MRTRPIFKIDLSKIEGAGEFLCPSCGIDISPEDLSEKNYRVLEVKTQEDTVQELIITCNKCGSIMRLSGFENLDMTEFMEEGET